MNFHSYGCWEGGAMWRAVGGCHIHDSSSHLRLSKSRDAKTGCKMLKMQMVCRRTDGPTDRPNSDLVAYPATKNEPEDEEEVEEIMGMLEPAII